MERPAKRISDSKFTLSALMGPQDANSHGNVHGGVIMKMVDEAGALVAMRHANAPVVTVAIDSMTFLQPIFLRNLVLCNAKLTYVGRTSMEVHIEVVAENPLENTSIVTNSAYVVYVAIDDDGRPIPVPPLIYETDAERANAAAAQARQEYRKQQRAAHIQRQESVTNP
jgi:uncharacterized protein (TIGR00369 family)